MSDRNGECLAKTFLDDNPRSASGLASLSTHLAVNGRIGKVPERGHELEGARYEGIWVLKPGPYRYFGFFRPGEFLLTNGAPKKRGVNSAPITRLHDA